MPEVRRIIGDSSAALLARHPASRVLERTAWQRPPRYRSAHADPVAAQPVVHRRALFAQWAASMMPTESPRGGIQGLGGIAGGILGR